VQEVVEFLKDATPFKRLGARMFPGRAAATVPRHGKTLLDEGRRARVRGTVLGQSASSFVEMFAGLGARGSGGSREARKHSPRDPVHRRVRRRRCAPRVRPNSEREETLTSCWSDGRFSRPIKRDRHRRVQLLDKLDPAFAAPGRFDPQVSCRRPTWRDGARSSMPPRTKPLREDVDLEIVAAQDQRPDRRRLGRNICNEAAIFCARRRGGSLRSPRRTFDDAAGARHRRCPVVDDAEPHERRVRRLHEAGHALCREAAEDGRTACTKISIVPRGARWAM